MAKNKKEQLFKRTKFKDEVALAKGKVFDENLVAANIANAEMAYQTGWFMLISLIMLTIYLAVKNWEGLNGYIAAYCIAPTVSLLLLSSKFWQKRPQIKTPAFRTFLICEFAATIGLINIVFPRHAILLWPQIIIISAQYYSPKVTRQAYFVTLIAMIICLYLGLFFGEWDSNLFNASGDYIKVGEQFYHESEMTIKLRWDYLAEHPDRYWRNGLFFGGIRATAITIIYLLVRTLTSRGLGLLTAQAGEVANREARTNELFIASSIQSAVLPKHFPSTPKGDIYALMNTAKEVGGDFYDYFYIDEGRSALVIADVSGKGVPAALFMMKTESLVKSIALATQASTAEIITQVNRGVCDGNDMNMFVTCWLGILDFRKCTLTYTSAGHNAPLLMQNGKFSYLKGKVGLVLGAFPTAKYVEETINLNKGDKLFLYTDGVTEAHNKEKELYGEERLLNLLNQNIDTPIKETIEIVRKDIDVHANGADQFDDITMLMAHFKVDTEAETVTKEFDAKVEENDEVTDFIGELLTKWGVERKLINSFKICAEEIFVNIASYAYGGATGKANITFTKEGDAVYLTFVDKGVEFNPLAKADPNIAMGAEERGIGGLGIFMVKKMMDAVTYRRDKDKNILTLKKVITPNV